MPEYGRGIQKMVELAITLPTKEERQSCANTIVAIMSRIQPQQTSQEESEHKLWNHLARISHYQLDIDYPVDIVAPEEVAAHPKPLKYPMKRIHRRHYGYLIEESLEYASSLEDGEEREALLHMIANQMKQNLYVWNRDSMDEALIAQDIARYTDGKLKLDTENFKFATVSLPTAQQLSGVQSKRKKKR